MLIPPLPPLMSTTVPTVIDWHSAPWGVVSLTESTAGGDGPAGLAAAVATLGVLMMAGQGGVVVPSMAQSAVLFGALAFGTAGYWAVTGATRTGEVSVVAPFRYARLVFAIIISAVVFAEIPDVITLSGSGLIIASGLYSFARERARKRTLSLNATVG